MNIARFTTRLLAVGSLLYSLSAFAANYDVKALIDTDNSRSTGCPVALPDGSTVTGIDTILTTSVTVTGTTGTVTAVTRQTCSGGSFGGPVPVDNGWHVGVSPAGDLLIESHLGPNVITMNNVGSPRFVFTTTSSGLLFDTLLQPNTTGGGDIIMRQAGRDRAVTPHPPRTIVLDGNGSDWAGDVPLANGTDNHPALRFISVNAYAGLTDLYFNFQIHTNPAAPTAHDDLYDLPTLGGMLSVATLGVLNNDNPNGQSISAVQVDNPQHGTVVLNANGGFVYSNDGAHVQQDQFHYFANGLLPSNIATVTIDMSGTKYVFTSADHVTFTAGVPSSFTVTVTGKPTPALSEDGALPAGITFVDNGDGTGTLSGTPTPASVGTYPLVLHAEKNKPHQADQSFTLTVACGGITVFNPAQSSFQAGVPLSQAFQQNGGIDPITWSESGALPPGLSFNTTTGVISGTPTQSGTFPITVTAHDANGCSGTGSQYNLIIICPAITVTNPVVTTGTVNVAFSQTFTQSGGFGTTTFSVFSGTLPAGLTLNPSTGVLSGTPTQKGSFPIVVRATDSHGCTGDGQTYNLTINCQVITVTNPATNSGTVNTAFSQTFTASNAIAPVTFTLNSGTLPAGITLAANGTLSGTPTQTGSFPITVKATDANGCTGIGTTYTLNIACQVITVTNPATNSGIVNTAFSQTFTAGNAIAPVTFTLNSGTLPAGITLSNAGVLSGTPTQTGSFPITVKATDANGCFAISPTYTLTISCQVITVTNPATNSGTINTPFTQTFTAGNTIGAVLFTLNSGTLPAGMSLSSGGVLSGIPTQTGSFSITVKATDANGCFGISVPYNFTINCQVITVTNPATTTGTAGTAFSQTFTQSGGFGATTFAIISGTLPTGMTFHAASGVLDGTPTQTGSFPLVIKATDANGCSGTGATYTLVIGCQTITVTNPATTTGTAGTAFSQTFTQSGGIGATTFAVFSGTLPTGMTLHPATGVLDGTPTQTGSFSLVIRATDSNNCTGNGATYTLVIGCQTITVTNPATSTGTAGSPFGQTFTESGSIGGATFSLNSGSLPAGLTLSSGGVLSGTPTQTGSFSITVKVTDSNGCTGVGATYTLVIGCQTITVTNPATTTGTILVPFSQTFTQSAAIGGATFSLNSGTLPAGLTLSNAGVLSGTPTVTGSFPITVKVTDGNGCTGVSAAYNLVINCQTITVTNPATTTGTVSTPFTQTFTQTGANGTATFTTASTLPAGLTLATNGTLSGTPTQTGTFNIVVTVTDSNGCTGTGATYTLIIGCQIITVNNPATTSSPAGTPISINFTQTGAVGTATFTTSSTLPSGLTLDPNGTLHGTPTGSGPFPIAVTVTDSNNCTGTNAAYTLTLTCPVITVTNPGVSTGTAGVAFSQTFTQSGGQGTITWSESGALPSGISLNSATGVLSGTTNVANSFPITVTATDANGCPGTGATYTLTINCQTVTVTNPGVNTGTVDAPFSQTFTVTGILGTVTWSETGGLPAGITLNPSTGVLSGTPTEKGPFAITVKATDTNGCFGTSPYTLTINCQTITVTNPGVSTGTVDAPFSQTFTQTGAHGTATFTTSDPLPSGLTLSSAGVLSGTPTVANTFPIVVTVTDANGCTGVSSTYTLVIGCQTITVTNPATSTGTAGTAFSQTFTQTGAHGSATFTTASPLPTGFTLTTAGVLSGTTTNHGTFPIVVTVTDANGCTGTGATYNLNLACNSISVTNPANSTGTVSAAFSEQFTQSGTLGTASFTTASPLPAGLTLHAATGILDGTPTQSGTFPIVVTVTDSNGCTGSGATYTLIISCQTITVNNPATTSSPAGAPLSINFTQTGAIGTATFTTASTLPTGLTLDPNGTLHGTPSGNGAFSIAVTVTDSNTCTGTNSAYTLTITCPTITVTNPGVTTGTAGVAFSQTFTQSGGQGTVTFAIISGSLPAGMTFHSATGVLDGTPTQTGPFSIVVQATDSNSCTGTGATYPLVINCQTISVTNPGVSTGTAGTPFSQTFTQSGAIGGATFSLNTGSLPAGLTLSAAGVLSGTPTQTGSFSITVKVTDGNGCTGISATYPLVINCQTITVTNPSSSTGTIQVALTPASSYTFSAANTIGAVSFTINSGALPAGVTLTSAGVVTGTPTVTGSFGITVKATDANGCFAISPTYTLVISCQTITVTNPAATTATVGTNFSDTFAQTGANGTATFTLNTGTLPNGITLAPNGALSGIPTQSGSFSITVKVTDSNACTGISPTYTLVVSCQTITVTNPATTTGTVGTAFNQTFTQTGGIGTITWSKTGAIPAGMTFHTTTGVLDGTPTASGSFPITVTATDQNGCAGTGTTYPLVISCNVINVSNPGVTTGTVDAAFSQSFTQTGANGTATFTLNSGSLPAGFALSTAGVLSGTPGAPSSSSFTVKVTDSNGCTGISPTYTLVIGCQTITVNNPGVTTGTVDAPFSQSFTQTGVGTHTPATFSLNSGSLAGTGLTLSSAGLLSGTPTAPGTIAITVKVTDANGCTGISATYTLVISCQTINVTNPGTSAGVIGTAFSQTFTQTGVGTHTPAVFTINSGTLPAGLSLSSAGVLSGTPTQTGVFPITVKVTDANGCTGIGATYNLSIAPSAVGDSYPAASHIVDNTQFVITGGSTLTPATPAVTSATNILTNDLPSGGVTATPGTFATTAGGSVTIAADGTFLYTPKVNPAAAATPTDSFNYTAVSNGVTSAPATVSLTLTNRVWYVKNNGAAGNGQSQSPFNTLAAAQAASLTNDILYVYNGDGLTTGQSLGITLKNNQQLIGEGVALVVNTVTLKAAGTKPQITNTTATSDVVTLADGNTVKGLTVTTATRDGIAGNTHAGFTGDTLTIQTSSSSGLHLTSMTGTVTVTNTTFSGANGTGLDINNGTAAITLDNTNSITANAGKRSVVIQNRPVAAGNVTIGAAITDNGLGISVSSNLSGTIAFTGTQTISAGTNQAVGVATNSGATITFSGTLSATTTTGTAFNATGGGNLNVSGTANITTGAAVTGGVFITGMTIGGSGVAFTSVNTTGAATGIVLTNDNGTISVNGGTISNGTTGISLQGSTTSLSLAGVTITGPTTGITNTTNFGTLTIGASVNVSAVTALNLTTGAISGTFANVTSSGGTNGVNLNAVTGTWGVTAGTLTGATGSTFNATGTSTGTVTWGGVINQTNGANAVTISGAHTGTINVTGNVTTSGTSTGISISASSGNYNFTGGTSTIAGTGGGITIFNESGSISFGSGYSINGPTTPFKIGGTATNTTANITYSGTITDNVNSGVLLDINSASGTYSTGTITFNGTSLSGSVNGAGGVSSIIKNITGTLIVNNLSLTSSNVNYAGTLVGISGTNTAGSFTFNHLTLSAAGGSNTGKGLTMTGGGTLTVTATGGSSTISVGSSVLDLNGIALGTSAIQTATSLGNGSASGILLNNVTGGTLTISGGTLTGVAGAGTFVVSGGTVSVTDNGTISQSAANKAINVSGYATGTLTFGGAITGATSGTGITLGAASGTIAFTGGITLNGTADTFTASNASGPGFTLNVTGTNSVGATTAVTSGIAVNINNTTIGSSGVTFQKISQTGGSSGISLNNTGSSGGFTVAGTGSAGSGGTIQNTTGSGISLTSVGGSAIAGASFTDMNISNTAGDGITGTTVKNFSCSLCVLTNPGGAANKSGMKLADLSGTASLTNVSVTGSATDGINITNSAATLTSLSITGGTLGSSNNAFFTAGSGLEVIAKSTGVITAATVSGVTFNANFSSGLQSFAQDTATIGDITVSGCTFTNNGAAAADFDAGTGSNPQMKFHFLNNLTITGNKGPVINVFSSSTATGGLIQGRIDGNHVGTAGVTDSGSTGGEGIRVFLQGVPGHITIVNNVIRATACSRGIGVSTLGPQVSGSFNRVSDIVITGNDVDNFSSDCSFPVNDIYLTADDQAGTTTTLRADVKNNKIKTAPGSPVNTDWPFDSAEWLYFDRTDSLSAGTPQPNSTSQLVGSGANANAVIAGQQTSGTAKANAAVTLIPGPITSVP